MCLRLSWFWCWLCCTCGALLIINYWRSLGLYFFTLSSISWLECRLQPRWIQHKRNSKIERGGGVEQMNLLGDIWLVHRLVFLAKNWVKYLALKKWSYRHYLRSLGMYFHQYYESLTGGDELCLSYGLLRPAGKLIPVCSLHYVPLRFVKRSFPWILVAELD